MRSRYESADRRRSVLSQLTVASAVACAAAAVAGGCGGAADAGSGSKRARSFAPSWSPDGRRILFSVDPDPAGGCGYGVCQFRIEIWVMDASGKHARRLARGTSPVWAPDGRRIAFERGGPVRDGVYTIRVDGTGLRRVAQSPAGAQYEQPTWSPDGTEIAYVRVSLGRGPNRLYVLDLNAPERRRIGRLAPDEVSWSPTGRLAFTTFDGLFTTDEHGQRVTRLFTSKNTEAHAITTGSGIAWSPDGTRIAFGVETTGGLRSFAVVDRRGRILVRPFTRTASSDDDPTWSPDGTRIAFARADGPQPGIYVVDGQGRRSRRLSTSGSHPTWSPDGRRIAFTDGDDIYVMNADGRARRKLYAAVAR